MTAEPEQFPKMYAGNLWKRTRAEQIAREPGCEYCSAPATAVSHRVPHRGCWASFLEPANLVSLCGEHERTHKPEL